MSPSISEGDSQLNIEVCASQQLVTRQTNDLLKLCALFVQELGLLCSEREI